jgi:hypothetical protein
MPLENMLAFALHKENIIRENNITFIQFYFYYLIKKIIFFLTFYVLTTTVHMPTIFTQIVLPSTIEMKYGCAENLI